MSLRLPSHETPVQVDKAPCDNFLGIPWHDEECLQQWERLTACRTM